MYYVNKTILCIERNIPNEYSLFMNTVEIKNEYSLFVNNILETREECRIHGTDIQDIQDTGLIKIFERMKHRSTLRIDL